MYNVNDTVVYGREGVCRIEEISQFDFMGEMSEYYVLRPMFAAGKENQVIYVPTSNKLLVGKMRKVLSLDEIHNLIDDMPDNGLEWVEDEGSRKKQYAKIIDESDPTTIAAAIRSIYLHKEKLESNGKKLHLCDDRMMQDAEKMLYNEFACVLSIQPDDVLPFIIDRLADSEKEA